jgi:protein-disulfide isomerase
MRDRLDRLATPVLLLVALMMAGAAVRRELRTPTTVAAGNRRPIAPPQYYTEWTGLLASGVLIGDSAAPVKVIEFADLECPVCRQFHARLAETRRKFRDKVAIVFVHYPLSYHRFARPAARAAECASRQDRFAEYVDVVYRKQDSLGLKSWASYGSDAAVADTGALALCARDTAQVTRIERGVQLGSHLEVRGTPTVLVNGWRFAEPPGDSVLTEAIARLLAGKSLSARRATGS